MKKKLVEYLSLSFINHIDYMLETKKEEYLLEKNFIGLSNRAVFLECKMLLEKTIELPKQKIVKNIIKQWALLIGADYDSYDFLPFTKIFTSRIFDLYLNTNESRECLTAELLSFEYELHQLNLTKTVDNENAMREVLRKFTFEYDKDSWGLVLKQSKKIQSTFIKYFEDNLKKKSKELEVLNQDLEKRVQIKSKEILDSLYLDTLTSLPNVNAFLNDSSKCEQKKNIILFSIDGFRKINSIYGYSFADEVLIQSAKKINQQVLTCGNYKLYRYHGDWFIILELNKNSNSVLDVYKHIVKLFDTQDIKIRNESLSLSFTAGVATSSKEPIKYAELAYQKAKKSKSSFEVYNGNSVILEEYKKHQHVLTTIKNAIKKDLVIPYFQLIRDNKNSEKKKYESLMRIEGPFGQIFSPYIFLDVAKDAKLYSALSQIMMRKTIQTFEHVDASFSINLEVEDILNKKTMQLLYDLIIQYKVQKKIIFEITESENVKDFKELELILEPFKNLGVKLAIDDFGTGYSNFSHLTQFDFDFIKIDGSLIKDIHLDENSFIVTQTIVEFAKRLGKFVIAEFIDNKEVQRVVESLGIDYSQGYLYSKPSTVLI